MADAKQGQLPPSSYTNVMMVTHNREEFVFTFGQLPLIAAGTDAPQAAHLIQMLVTSPGHAKRMLKALQENVEKYERNFGEIRADSPGAIGATKGNA